MVALFSSPGNFGLSSGWLLSYNVGIITFGRLFVLVMPSYLGCTVGPVDLAVR